MSERLVYYSLTASPDGACERQWTQSIRSLRRFNRTAAVGFIVYGDVPAAIRSEADRWDVRLHAAGPLSDCLHQLHVHGRILSAVPTLHKLLSLRHLDLPETGQILYLDCDTYFFGDVEALFDTYCRDDFYAREEHCSRRSDFAYDPEHVDEDALEAIARQEALRPVLPFNSGVCLLNHGVWRSLTSLDVNYLDFAWRLLVGRLIATGGRALGQWGMGPEVMATIADADRARALPFPSENDWIIEQIALWLTFGYLRDRTEGLLDAADVAQNGEFDPRSLGTDCPVVTHYFSSNELSFFERVEPIDD